MHKTKFLTLLVSFNFFLSFGNAHAALQSETWIVTGSPTHAQIEKWKKLVSPREIRVLLSDAPSRILSELLEQLPDVEKFQISSNDYPTRNSLAAWKEISKNSKVEWISNSGRYPTPVEAETMNEIGFSKIVFVLGKYPEKGDSEKLLTLKTPYSISFNAGRYPHFMEKVELAKLPPSIPLQIVVDYWPRYVQMDVWNLIPQTEKRLRIVNCAVSAGNLTYLENMKDLKELIIVSDGNPPLKEWDQLSPYPIRWIANNSVPSQASLEAFTLTERRGLEKNLVLDHDAKLTASEKTRISESALPIEWTHAAP